MTSAIPHPPVLRNCCDADKIDPPCPSTFDASSGLNEILEISGVKTNVVCNFMGTTLSNTQVVLVRKPTFTDEGGATNAVFLINSITTDAVGRRKIIQGVVIVPFVTLAGPTYILTPLKTPYLSTTKLASGS